MRLKPPPIMLQNPLPYSLFLYLYLFFSLYIYFVFIFDSENGRAWKDKDWVLTAESAAHLDALVSSLMFVFVLHFSSCPCFYFPEPTPQYWRGRTLWEGDRRRLCFNGTSVCHLHAPDLRGHSVHPPSACPALRHEGLISIQFYSIRYHSIQHFLRTKWMNNWDELILFLNFCFFLIALAGEHPLSDARR